MRSAILLLAASGCLQKNALYCDETHECPAGMFCDLTGATPASGGHGRTCVSSLVDAGGDAHMPDAEPIGPLLTVGLQGTGAGTVRSDPAGISCPPVCSVRYLPGTIVTLTATPGAGSRFAIWSGACTGASCAVVMDDDRDTIATFQDVVVWARTFGGPANDVVNAVASRGDDTVLVGSFSGTLGLGGACAPLVSDGPSSDVFVVDLAPGDGACFWARRFGGPGVDEALAVVSTTTSDVMVAGSFEGTVDLGDGPVTATGGKDTFVLYMNGASVIG